MRADARRAHVRRTTAPRPGRPASLEQIAARLEGTAPAAPGSCTKLVHVVRAPAPATCPDCGVPQLVIPEPPTPKTIDTEEDR